MVGRQHTGVSRDDCKEICGSGAAEHTWREKKNGQESTCRCFTAGSTKDKSLPAWNEEKDKSACYTFPRPLTSASVILAPDDAGAKGDVTVTFTLKEGVPESEIRVIFPRDVRLPYDLKTVKSDRGILSGSHQMLILRQDPKKEEWIQAGQPFKITFSNIKIPASSKTSGPFRISIYKSYGHGKTSTLFASNESVRMVTNLGSQAAPSILLERQQPNFMGMEKQSPVRKHDLL